MADLLHVAPEKATGKASENATVKATEKVFGPTVLCRFDNNPGNFLHRHGHIVLLNDWEQTLPVPRLLAEGCLYARAASGDFPGIWQGYLQHDLQHKPNIQQRLPLIKQAAAAAAVAANDLGCGILAATTTRAYPPPTPAQWANNLRQALAVLS